MSISMSVLGSGSAGNCSLLILHRPGGARHILIDAGLSPRLTATRLGPLGVSLGQIGAILLTHVDYDHFHPGWIAPAVSLKTTWHIHRRHLDRAIRAGLPIRSAEPFDEAPELGAATVIDPVLLPHDQLGTTGFVIDHGGARLGYATDLGRVPATFFQRFTNLSALAIESNYDRRMQMNSLRPAALKRRIMGGLGHLSNEQALDAVLRLAEHSDLRHIALLHLSRHCNDPRIVQRLYARRAPDLLDRLTISNQHQPTPLLHISRARGRPTSAAQPQRPLSFQEVRPQ